MWMNQTTESDSAIFCQNETHLVIGVPAEVKSPTATDRRKTEHQSLGTPAKNVTDSIHYT